MLDPHLPKKQFPAWVFYMTTVRHSTKELRERSNAAVILILAAAVSTEFPVAKCQKGAKLQMETLLLSFLSEHPIKPQPASTVKSEVALPEVVMKKSLF